ncbi:hypothetical protein Tsubulata_043522, partial [Turnera subulata]
MEKHVISMARPIVEEAVAELLHQNLHADCLRMADLGCSSGPNALKAPALQFFLNDLSGNDFNTGFSLTNRVLFLSLQCLEVSMVDSFQTIPCILSILLIIPHIRDDFRWRVVLTIMGRKKGSFNIGWFEQYEINRDVNMEDGDKDLFYDKWARGKYVSKYMRAVTETLLASQFGAAIMDDLYHRLSLKVADYLKRGIALYHNL